MLTGSVPSTATIDRSAFRNATNGPLAPVAPRPTSTRSYPSLATRSAPHGSWDQRDASTVRVSNIA